MQDICPKVTRCCRKAGAHLSKWLGGITGQNSWLCCLFYQAIFQVRLDFFVFLGHLRSSLEPESCRTSAQRSPGVVGRLGLPYPSDWEGLQTSMFHFKTLSFQTFLGLLLIIFNFSIWNLKFVLPVKLWQKYTIFETQTWYYCYYFLHMS